MSDDRYRKIEPLKPSGRPVPVAKPRRRLPLGLDRLFEERRYVFSFLIVFFLLGALIGGYLGSQSKERQADSWVPAATPSGSQVPAAPIANTIVRAYAFSTPSLRPEIKPEPVSPKQKPKPKATVKPDTHGSPVKFEHGSPSKQKLASVTPDRTIVTNPRIAIVIDDLGIDQKRTRNAIALKGPLTMAFLPYGYNLRALTEDALSSGHELIVHLPMQPMAAGVNPGPNALLHNLVEDEIRSRLAWNLSQFDGFVGINNHMGSNFTTWDEGMSVVLKEIKARDLFYLDSLTSPNSVAKSVGRREGLSVMVRDVFLDNEPDETSIKAQLLELEKISSRRGYAIGIGHPYDATMAALSEWLNTLSEKGFVLVPLSKIQRRYP
jgi:polysaccharide deacetylase 2 family uncharacterized protein YibQ